MGKGVSDGDSVGVGVNATVGAIVGIGVVGMPVLPGDNVAAAGRTASASILSAGSQITNDAQTQPIRSSHCTATQSPSVFRPRGDTRSL